VFHQQVDVGVPAVQRRGEQQVRVPPLQRLVDKARRHRGQPPQVYPGRQVRRQDGPQLGRSWDAAFSGTPKIRRNTESCGVG
jgi:hypothetical protein